MVVLADDLWFVAHDEGSGRARVADQVLGVGLAAGLVLELVALGRVRVWGQELMLVGGPAPSDVVAHEVFTDLASADRSWSVADTVDALTPSAVERVTRRLVRRGEVAVRRRWWVSRRVPTSMVRAGAPAAVLMMKLREYPVVRWAPGDVELIALAGAMGVDRVVWPDLRAQAAAMVSLLPASSVVVVDAVRASVLAGVVSPG